MKVRSLLTCFSLAFATSASVWGFDERPNETPYAMIERHFATAFLPGIEHLEGWHSGRCYFAGSQSKPKNGLFAAILVRDDENHGPWIPGDQTLHLLPLSARGGADLFDELSESERDLVENYIRDEFQYYPAATVRDGSWIATYNGPYYPSNQVEWAIRQSGPYLLNRLTLDGKIEAYCYYFNRVK